MLENRSLRQSTAAQTSYRETLSPNKRSNKNEASQTAYSSVPVITDLLRSYFMDIHQRMQMNVPPREVLFWHKNVSENQGSSRNSDSIFDVGSILDLSYLEKGVQL